MRKSRARFILRKVLIGTVVFVIAAPLSYAIEVGQRGYLAMESYGYRFPSVPVVQRPSENDLLGQLKQDNEYQVRQAASGLASRLHEIALLSKSRTAESSSQLERLKVLVESAFTGIKSSLQDQKFFYDQLKRQGIDTPEKPVDRQAIRELIATAEQGRLNRNTASALSRDINGLQRRIEVVLHHLSEDPHKHEVVQGLLNTLPKPYEGRLQLSENHYLAKTLPKLLEFESNFAKTFQALKLESGGIVLRDVLEPDHRVELDLGSKHFDIKELIKPTGFEASLLLERGGKALLGDAILDLSNGIGQEGEMTLKLTEFTGALKAQTTGKFFKKSVPGYASMTVQFNVKKQDKSTELSIPVEFSTTKTLPIEIIREGRWIKSLAEGLEKAVAMDLPTQLLKAYVPTSKPVGCLLQKFEYLTETAESTATVQTQKVQ